LSEKKTLPELYSEKVFKGKIELDVRDSTPDWGPYKPPQAPEGAPNVLFVLYDDTGLAAWSPYGGRINMPAAQKLADRGLLYTVAHDCPVWADPIYLPDRPEPSRQRLRRNPRRFQRLPRLSRPAPRAVCHRGPHPAGCRLEHLLGGQGPQRSRTG